MGSGVIYAFKNVNMSSKLCMDADFTMMSAILRQ